MAARFTNRQKTAMLEARIAKEAFSIYHVKGEGQHVRLTLSSRQLVRVLEKRSPNSLHLQVNEHGERIQAGDIGNEHNLLGLVATCSRRPTGRARPFAAAQNMPATIHCQENYSRVFLETF